ncbi:MAG: RNA polymerase sigma factor [Alphaproteobacteria bacterium]|nr:RNA polymerase sigma factor [Alphaproteobacteria bacterium]
MTGFEIDDAVRAQLARSVSRVCPAWMRDELDDLVQMAVMRLLRSSAEVEPTPGYLSRVAYSAVIDEIRRKKRRNEVRATPSLFDRVADEVAITPEQLARAGQVGAVVLECLETLVPARRRAVTLYLQGHSVPEIAELLDWETKKASNAVYRGLDDLRARLAERGVSP